MFLRCLFSLLAVSALYAGENVLFFTPEMITTHLKSYNEAEKALIEKDLAVVRSVCFGDVKAIEGRAPLYVATAGAPGARKTTILERFIHEHPEMSQGVYLDPDPRTLRFMVHTYYSQSLNYRMIASSREYEDVLKAAYEKWRGASNYISLTLLEEAFRQKLDIVYGTTSTGAHMAQFLPRVKAAGYQIVFVLCSCDDEVRKKAIEFRNKEIRFYQSSPEDALAKGKYFSERMQLYFQHGDKLFFFWSDDLFKPERLAAVLDGANFEIRDFEAYVKFVGKYESDRKAHLAEGKQLPTFQELLTARTGRDVLP
jgi:hypothetical protein